MTVNYIRVADTVLLSNGVYTLEQNDIPYTLNNGYICIANKYKKLEVIITEEITEVGDHHQGILNAMHSIREVVGNYKGIEVKLSSFEGTLRKEIKERFEFKQYLDKVEKVYAIYPHISIELKTEVMHFDWSSAYEKYDDRLTASHASKRHALNKKLDAVVDGQEYAKAIRSISN